MEAGRAGLGLRIGRQGREAQQKCSRTQRDCKLSHRRLPRLNERQSDDEFYGRGDNAARIDGSNHNNFGTGRELSNVSSFERWRLQGRRERIKSCTMIICEPNELVAEAHDRMPVLLQPDQFDHWLSGDMGVEELKPAPNDYLQRWSVSKRVNSSKADKDDATLIEPIDLTA
jgi:hypothetical protein